MNVGSEVPQYEYIGVLTIYVQQFMISDVLTFGACYPDESFYLPGCTYLLYLFQSVLKATLSENRIGYGCMESQFFISAPSVCISVWVICVYHRADEVGCYFQSASLCLFTGEFRPLTLGVIAERYLLSWFTVLFFKC